MWCRRSIERVGMIWRIQLNRCLWMHMFTMTFWSGLGCSPRACTRLVHLMTPPISLRQVSFVLTDIHASITLLVALAIAYTQIGYRSSSTIQPRSLNFFILGFQYCHWRPRTRKHVAFMRKFSRFRESYAKHVATFQVFRK